MKQLETALNKQKVIRETIVQAENMLLSTGLLTDQFNSNFKRLNSDLMDVNNEIEVLSSNTDSIKEYVSDGLALLENLDRLFHGSEYEEKWISVGSLFTKKQFFGNQGCRTTQVYEVVEVLSRSSKGFGGAKKEKASISDSFSASVPYGLKLSNFIEDFNRIRKLKSFMEMKQFN